MSKFLLAFGNVLFVHCYWLYLPLYKAYKTLSDRRERAFLRGLIKPGMKVIDVGANIGIYSNFLASLTGPTGAVYAFEPSPLNFTLLQKNIRNVPVITAVEAAVGERSGSVTLFLSDKANVDHRTYDSGDSRASTTVQVVALDDYFPADTKIDVIKIDVQGHEYSVLKGAARLLRDNPQIVCLLEVWPYGLSRAGVTPQALMQLISSFGFDYKVVGEQGSNVIEYPDFSAEDKYCNIAIWRAKA